MLLILCAGQMMGCSKTLSVGLENKLQEFWLWFRQLFKASKTAPGEKEKQRYLETAHQNWYCVGEAEQSNAWPALKKESVLCVRSSWFHLLSAIRYALGSVEEKLLGSDIRNLKQS